MPKIGTDYLRVSVAASYLGVHKDTLKNWEARGILVPVRFGSRRDRLYNKRVLDQFFQEHIKQATDKIPTT